MLLQMVDFTTSMYVHTMYSPVSVYAQWNFRWFVSIFRIRNSSRLCVRVIIYAKIMCFWMSIVSLACVRARARTLPPKASITRRNFENKSFSKMNFSFLLFLQSSSFISFVRICVQRHRMLLFVAKSFASAAHKFHFHIHTSLIWQLWKNYKS